MCLIKNQDKNLDDSDSRSSEVTIVAFIRELFESNGAVFWKEYP